MSWGNNGVFGYSARKWADKVDYSRQPKKEVKAVKIQPAEDVEKAILSKAS
jgi:hypothetical protein